MMETVKHTIHRRIDGVTVQKMITVYDYELIIGSRKTRHWDR